MPPPYAGYGTPVGIPNTSYVSPRTNPGTRSTVSSGLSCAGSGGVYRNRDRESRRVSFRLVVLDNPMCLLVVAPIRYVLTLAALVRLTPTGAFPTQPGLGVPLVSILVLGQVAAALDTTRSESRLRYKSVHLAGRTLHAVGAWTTPSLVVRQPHGAGSFV